MILRILACALLLAWSAGACARAQAVEICLSDTGALPVAAARELPIGSYRGPQVSANARAQRFFEQGLVYGWGFNFAEAVRSFRAAAVDDPGCALCRWGIGWALGPSINHDMRRADVPVALDAIVQARVNAKSAPEEALIDALAQRYSNDPAHDEQESARRYAAAMLEVARRFAVDADIAVLAAEALMTAHAYDYWNRKGEPRPWTPDIERLLDRALQLAPDHPGAHHYRIHLYEDAHPRRALDSAQRLPEVAAGIGHLLHMPSHLYLRLGRYHEAVLANRSAVDADREYLRTVGGSAEYAAGYVIHNLHFLWVAALSSGESRVAMHAAWDLARLAAQLPPEHAGNAQHFAATPWLTDLHFGRFGEVLERPLPLLDRRPYLDGLVRYARGSAHVATGDAAAGERELAELDALLRATVNGDLEVRGIHRAHDILQVARALLASDLAALRGKRNEALRLARAAVAAEDRLQRDEPPVWQRPARRQLGRLLLEAKRFDAARDAFAADLVRYPETAVSLTGLADAEHGLGRVQQAHQLRARAAAAWRHADLPLLSDQSRR